MRATKPTTTTSFFDLHSRKKTIECISLETAIATTDLKLVWKLAFPVPALKRFLTIGPSCKHASSGRQGKLLSEKAHHKSLKKTNSPNYKLYITDASDHLIQAGIFVDLFYKGIVLQVIG